MDFGPSRRVRLPYDLSDLFRRYFINTLFDSTFVVLGIVSATAVVTETRVEVTLGTLVSACLAIGVSTGVSVYEAERLEARIRLSEIERAMLADLTDTDVARRFRRERAFVSLVNLAAPLFVFAVTSLPFVFHVILGAPSKPVAAQLSILSAIVLVFATGLVLGKVLGVSPFRQGLRMTVAAILTFLALVAVQTAIL